MLIFPCADKTAEGQMLEENFLADMCCNKGVQFRDDEEDAEVRMIVFNGEQPIRQKEKRCPDENVEQDAHQFVYPSETSQSATSCFACTGLLCTSFP